MRTVIAVCLLLMTSGPAAQQRRGGGGGFTQPEPIAFDDHEGWKIIFDGNSLKDWDGNMDVWRLENGAIVGTSTPEKPSSTTYMIWKGGEEGFYFLLSFFSPSGGGSEGRPFLCG